MNQSMRVIFFLAASLLFSSCGTFAGCSNTPVSAHRTLCFVAVSPGSRQQVNHCWELSAEKTSQTSGIDDSKDNDQDPTWKPSFATADEVGTYYNPFEARDAARAGSSSLSSLNLSTEPSVSSNPWAATGTPRNVISVRKLQMQQATVELLEAVDDDQHQTQLQSVLESHRDVLLAPFLPNFVDDDPDSIYTPEMTAEERRATYQMTIEKRIANARNASVQKVLKALNAYISSEIPK